MAMPSSDSFQFDNTRSRTAAAGCAIMVPMTADQFRNLALSLEGAKEGQHHGHADFRVNGKIFATLAYEKEGCGVVMLAPDQQRGVLEDAPEMFTPVNGAWGRNGATMVLLAKATRTIVLGALQSAWLLKRKTPAGPGRTGRAAASAPSRPRRSQRK
jgi:hypothetical protein